MNLVPLSIMECVEKRNGYQKLRINSLNKFSPRMEHMRSAGTPWLILQFADSSFPVGGFAHSGGIEAALQFGEVTALWESIGQFCSELVKQTAFGALTFVNSAHTDSGRLAEFDEYCNAFLSNHVANRASRVQGRAFLSTCSRSFELPEFKALKVAHHFAPIFGAVSKSLGISLTDARQLFMYLTIRGTLSAAVRLNAIGSYDAQKMQLALVPEMDRALDETAHLEAVDAAQTAPLLEIFQMSHDRLYSRLFQS